MFSLVPVASIEVGKHFLDLGFHPAAKPLWCDNTPAGIEQPIDALRQCGVLRVALQATNPDAHSITRALAEDGFSSRWSIRVGSGPGLASSYSRCFSSPFSGMDRIGSKLKARETAAVTPLKIDMAAMKIQLASQPNAPNAFKIQVAKKYVTGEVITRPERPGNGMVSLVWEKRRATRFELLNAVLKVRHPHVVGRSPSLSTRTAK